MIKEITEPKEYGEIGEFLLNDKHINYFILQGLYQESSVFKASYAVYDEGELVGGIFIRKSNNAHLYLSNQTGIDLSEVVEFLYELKVGEIYAVGWIIDFIERTSAQASETTSFVSKLESKRFEVCSDDIRRLDETDMDAITRLYDDVFGSYTPEEIMIKNLLSEGSAFGIKKDKQLISISQSIFKDNRSAIIFGVATDPEYRRRGFGEKVIKYHLNELFKELEVVYLLYKNPVAGKLYSKLGFEDLEEMKKIKLL